METVILNWFPQAIAGINELVFLPLSHMFKNIYFVSVTV
jgi:hypothetical protein